MAEDIKKNQQVEEEESALVNAADNMDIALAKSEAFIEKNQKMLLSGFAVIVLIAIGVIFYIKEYRNPRIESANTAIAKAQQLFLRDSFQVALDDPDGFLGVIDEYSGTPAGDLAYAYAGLCYKKLGENEKAIEYLEKFSCGDKVLDPALNGAIGDCYLEMNATDKAISYYNKAISSKNSLIAPIYMERLALIYVENGDTDKAINLWKQIKSDYSKSMQAQEADKMIGYLEAK